jgi:hypothetical protein
VTLEAGEHVRFNTRNGQTRLESRARLFGEQIVTCPATMRQKVIKDSLLSIYWHNLYCLSADMHDGR